MKKFLTNVKALAIIPARGGSKGIKKKNLKKLDGKPLIFYTIESAKKSKKFDRIIVSTDNKEIAKISKKFGADVPFSRPSRISGDDIPMIKVIKHAVDFLEKEESYIPDIISILQPTSPLRTSKIITDSFNLLKKNNSTSVISVSKTKHHPFSLFIKKKYFLKPSEKNFEKYTLRQSLSSLYHPNGTIYTFWNKTLKKYDSIYGPRIFPLIINDPIQMLDIDNTFDFFITEMTKKYWKNYQKYF